MQLKAVENSKNEAQFVRLLLACFLIGTLFVFEVHADGAIFRMSNFSNEFKTTTSEGINARGFAKVRTNSRGHRVKIRVNGLTPGAAFVVINHWFDPIPARGIGSSDPAEDPSCNGHFQFLGVVPTVVDRKGRLKINARVPQLAPHIWVVNFANFLEVTNNRKQAPSSPSAFVIGGLVNPFADLLEAEEDFDDTDPLTDCP